MTHRGLGDRWLAGGRIEGVAFAQHERVEVVSGRFLGHRGRILLLVGLDPEPGYLVQLDGGVGDAKVRQGALRRTAAPADD